MVTEEDYLIVKDAVKEVQRSLLWPNEKAFQTLYKFYKKINPKDRICMTCPSERGKVLKYCKRFLKTWQTNQ